MQIENLHHVRESHKKLVNLCLKWAIYFEILYPIHFFLNIVVQNWMWAINGTAIWIQVNGWRWFLWFSPQLLRQLRRCSYSTTLVLKSTDSTNEIERKKCARSLQWRLGSDGTDLLVGADTVRPLFPNDWRISSSYWERLDCLWLSEPAEAWNL